MANASSAPQATSGRHQRRLRNYLIDAEFQLKYVGYFVGIALVLSVSLGLILWRVSDAVIVQSQQSVSLGQDVVTRGRQVVHESEKVSAVVKMNIIKDPVYQDNPALLDAFQADAKDQDELLRKQQADLESQSALLAQQSKDMAHRQQVTGLALVVLLSLLVLGIGCTGIVVTHKIAGPIYKMKRQIGELKDGSLVVPYPLRKGDELVSFFEAFREMVGALRERKTEEIEEIDKVLAAMEGESDGAGLLRDFRSKLSAQLD
ncbi:MAG: HAMP domain-containing protein [Polyangiaceae bacterium]|nr:HAMP domain-containing protein [Polyangiaceae bacterium]